MKYAVLIFIWFLFKGVQLDGQSASISFSHAVLPVQSDEEKSYDGILRAKIQKQFSKKGPSESIPNYSIVVRPKIIFYSSDISATAPPYYTSDMELSLELSDYRGTVVFGTYNMPMKGAGRSKEKSITNGMKNLRFNDKKFHKFIEDSESKIVPYLKDKSESIIADAKRISGHDKLGDTEEGYITLSRLGMLRQYDIRQEEVTPLLNKIAVMIDKTIGERMVKQNEIDRLTKENELLLDQNESLETDNKELKTEAYNQSPTPTSFTELFLGIGHNLATKAGLL